MPDNILIQVDFPAPFGPRKPHISPAGIEKETSDKACLVSLVGKIKLFKAAENPSPLLTNTNVLFRFLPLVSFLSSIRLR